MKTARLNLLVTPEAKIEITARATSMNLSTSELVRRAVFAYEPSADDEELRALATELLETVSRTEQALESAIERLEHFEENLARNRSEVRESVRAAAEEWPFPVFAPREQA